MTITTLGELRTRGLLDFNDGYRTKKDQLAASGFRIIRAGDINNGEVSPTGPDHVAEAYASAIGQKVLHDNDVVLTTKGTIGRTALVRDATGHEIYSPQLCFFRPDSSVLLAKYLYFWLSGPEFTYQSSFMKNSTDMAPYISLSQLSDTRITLPPLPEQQAIAEVLGALDDKIAANRKLVTTSLTLAEAVHDLALSDEQRPLGDFMEFAYGKSLPATRRIPGEVPVVGSGGVTGSHDEALVNRPGIVVGRKGSMGTVRWMDEPFFPIDTTFYVTNKTGIPDQFWYFSLKQARFEGLNSDSAVPGLNREAALEQLTRTPSESGIKRFEDVALPLFELATANRRESQTLSQLRDTLLPALMDGTIRVKDAERLAEEAV